MSSIAFRQKIRMRRRWFALRRSWYRHRYGVRMEGPREFGGTMLPKLGRGKYVTVRYRGPFLDIRDERTGELIRLVPYQPNHGVMVEFWPTPERLTWRTHADFAVFKHIGDALGEVARRQLLEQIVDLSEGMADVAPWSEVSEGDSVLYQGRMVTVVSRGPEAPDPQVVQWNVRLSNGTEVLAAVFADYLTAVRSAPLGSAR